MVIGRECVDGVHSSNFWAVGTKKSQPARLPLPNLAIRHLPVFVFLFTTIYIYPYP